MQSFLKNMIVFTKVKHKKRDLENLSLSTKWNHDCRQRHILSVLVEHVNSNFGHFISSFKSTFQVLGCGSNKFVETPMAKVIIACRV